MAPYIGITGVMTPQEVRYLTKEIPSAPSHDLMLGVLVSWKTLQGIPNKYPRLFPSVARISEILEEEHPHLVKLIHYSVDKEQEDTLSDQLLRLVDIAGSRIHGFQLNIAWPHLLELEKFRKVHAAMRLILQIGPVAMAMTAVGREESPQRLCEQTRDYVSLVDDVLLDASAGKGLPLDPGWTQQYLSVLWQRYRFHLGLGVAGGLGPGPELNRVRPLLSNTPWHKTLSIDAQAGVHDPETEDLDHFGAASYYVQALRMFEVAAKENETQRWLAQFPRSRYPIREADPGD